MASVVDETGNGFEDEVVVIHGAEEVADIFVFLKGGIEPTRGVVRLEDDGHAVVVFVDAGVGLDGEEATGYGGLIGFDSFVGFPDAGHEKRLLVGAMDIVGLFAVPLSFGPFVIAIGDDDASLFGEGLLEAWFFGDGFAAGVDHLCADRGIFGPGWDQAPTGEGGVSGVLMEIGLRLHNGENRLGGGDVIAGRNFGHVQDLQVGEEFLHPEGCRCF